MLPGRLALSPWRSSAPAACSLCACRCGSTFRARPFSTSRASDAQAAPSTRNKDRTRRALSPEHARKWQENRKERRSLEIQLRQLQLRWAQREGFLRKDGAQVESFLTSFATFSETNKLRVGSEAPLPFQDLAKDHSMTPMDLLTLSFVLLANELSEGDRYWGRKLLDAMSAAGYLEATIRIVNNALLSAKHQPGLLRNASVAVERGRLQKAAREGLSSRAMVLEGKVAYFLGDHDTAIKWWWRAIEGAVEKSTSDISMIVAGNKSMARDVSRIDRSDLSTPWIELIEAHFDRSLKGRDEWGLCEKAIQIGLEQEDPTAFYYAATYHKKRHEDGTHLPTSDWLYYMTKAAASGVPKAAYELGVYYAESGWKYIEDEPPDHVKPTPFDTYPGSGATTFEGFWGIISRLFAAPPSAIQIEREQIFHTASWPETPEKRARLAHYWLEIAQGYCYAPAYLYMAKLCMQETLWAGARAPTEALGLSSKRYLYRSKEDEADAHFSGELKTWEVPEGEKDPRNPFYDLDDAKKNLVEVCHARNAVRQRKKNIDRHAQRTGTKNVDWEDLDFEDRGNIRKIHPSTIRFLNNMDVYEMWAAESDGLINEAHDICDYMGWTLYDDQQGLLYKASMARNSNVWRELYSV
ncbi:hypothetical protein WHR41_07914 [Cladosporium halotolerans]|uniref:Uncharacterized protein n=1 Tax=Cladosporium halotolerans TaxID=1052096 RepID=A0AB34KHD8_9PEZI